MIEYAICRKQLSILKCFYFSIFFLFLIIENWKQENKKIKDTYGNYFIKKKSSKDSYFVSQYFQLYVIRTTSVFNVQLVDWCSLVRKKSAIVSRELRSQSLEGQLQLATWLGGLASLALSRTRSHLDSLVFTCSRAGLNSFATGTSVLFPELRTASNAEISSWWSIPETGRRTTYTYEYCLMWSLEPRGVSTVELTFIWILSVSMFVY